MAVGGCGTFKCTGKLGVGEGGGRYDLNDCSHQYINVHPPHIFPDDERSLNYRH